MEATDLAKSVNGGAVVSLRVLLLEPSQKDAEKILHELRAAGFAIEPTILSRREEFLEAISSIEFSVILSAYQLPDWNAMEALEELRNAGKNVPFLLVTGAGAAPLSLPSDRFSSSARRSAIGRRARWLFST